MLDTFIFLLQEESERLCGRALPPEMCRYILIQCGGWQTPSAIAWKNMERHNRSQLYRIRDKWRCLNAIITRQRKENNRLYYSARARMHPDHPHALCDHRFWIPRWASQEFNYPIGTMQEVEAAEAALSLNQKLNQC